MELQAEYGNAQAHVFSVGKHAKGNRSAHQSLPAEIPGQGK